MLVHITNDDETESVRRSGIKIGKYRDGVYAIPVLPNFIVSNQWLRELKRRVSGSRTLSAIHFRIPDTETVYMGHYSQEHVELTAAEAAGAIMHAEDPLGMGDHHPACDPNARARNMCGCPACLPAGTYKSRIFRERFYNKD